MNQDKATGFAKFVDQGTLRKIVKLNGEQAAEAKAALEIQAICKKQQAKTGIWPDRDLVAAEYFKA